MVAVNTENMLNEAKEDVLKLISNYNYIHSFLMKLQYIKDLNKISNFIDGLLSRIDEILSIEEKIYSIIKGARKQCLFTR